MELTDYRQELITKVQEMTFEEDLLDQEAFFQVACEILRDCDAIVDSQPIEPGYRFGKGTNQFMAIDGYDQSSFDMDESIVIIVCDDDYSIRTNDKLPTIQAHECQRYINAMRRFIVSAWNGSFLQQGEESGAAYEFASFIHDHRANISRFRLYFISDREYTGRDSTIKDPTDFYSTDDEKHKVSLEAHVWDLQHLMEAAQASAPLEHLTVNLGNDGIPAVEAPSMGNGMETYLLFLPGEMLATWYKKHGSKLMEANVRSFLSMRGKVNRGIRSTLLGEPEKFVAYNNGLSATASSLTIDEQHHITAIQDLQIVNGGQTTASIFYSQQKDKLDLSKVMVPAKLVIVQKEVARDLVPNISRYTNSQNKVTETDFSSNSEYQVKLSQLSQQILTPPLPGKYQTHWYYERTRGQYENEKNRRKSTERKQFEKLNPSKQRIKMIDAPKYLVCWDGKPQIASLGSQKCFAKFIAAQSDKEDILAELNVTFFKQLVCKRIIFDTVYKNIKNESWYKGSYRANIAEYAVAKFAFDLNRADYSFDFEKVWHNQSISDDILECLLRAAEQAYRALTDEHRPIQNVSEWAKKPTCWENLKRYPFCLQSIHYSSLYRPAGQPRHTRPISAGDEIPSIPAQPRHKAASHTPIEMQFGDWADLPHIISQELYDFADSHDILTPETEDSLKNLMYGNIADVNIDSLNQLLQKAVNSDFKEEHLNDAYRAFDRLKADNHTDPSYDFGYKQE